VTSKSYKIIEHTADIGVMVEGKDLAELFVSAARAMFSIMAEPRDKSSCREKPTKHLIDLQADSLEDLFISWLNELLSLSAVNYRYFSDFKVDSVSETELRASAIGLDIQAYHVNMEIKAATFHELSLTKSPAGYKVKVIFDV
jgi:SHS2 domain-containing protein